MSYKPVAKSDILDNTLDRPLLDSDHDSTGSGVMSNASSTEDLATIGKGSGKSHSSKYNEYLAGRIYASNAPKILLETITARTATVIIALTYIFFLLGFCVDFYTTYRSFHSSNYKLSALPCSTGDVNQTANFISCSSGRYWNATVTELANVISVKLDVEQKNVSSQIANTTDVFDLKYNIDLWACYNQEGCGTRFASDDYYTDDADTWQHVYFKNEQDMRIDVEVDVSKDGETEQLTKSLFPSTFQNQESIPTNGLVKAYFISVEYTDDPYNLFISQKNDSYHDTFYYFDVVERPRQETVNIVTILLLFVTLFVLGWYVHMLSQQKKVLSEQKWVVAYFALLVLFQNPVYCIIVFYKNAPSVQDAYASYVIGYIAQSGLFILWLLFADSIHRKTANKRIFYGPKVFIGLVIFTFGKPVCWLSVVGIALCTVCCDLECAAVSCWIGCRGSMSTAFLGCIILNSGGWQLHFCALRNCSVQFPQPLVVLITPCPALYSALHLFPTLTPLHCAACACIGIVILTFQFPGLSASQNEHARSAVQAVANWTPRLRAQFIVFTIMYLMLIWVW
jgi:hypothetical protein